jgi:hypothetical protein
MVLRNLSPYAARWFLNTFHEGEAPGDGRPENRFSFCEGLGQAGKRVTCAVTMRHFCPYSVVCIVGM